MPSPLRTRETIIQAADDLFYGEGIRAASMDAIAESTRSTFVEVSGHSDAASPSA